MLTVFIRQTHTFQFTIPEISDIMESYDDPEMGDGYAMYKDKDGNEYQLVITTNINGNVDPDDALLIIKK